MQLEIENAGNSFHQLDMFQNIRRKHVEAKGALRILSLARTPFPPLVGKSSISSSGNCIVNGSCSSTSNSTFHALLK